MKSKRLLIATVAAFTAFAPLRAAESTAAIIERAREFLGGDKVLNQVTSLHFTGTVEIKIEGAGAPAGTTPVKNDIEFIFQRPLDYLMKRTDTKGKETVGLSGYDAWSMIEIPGQPTRLIMESPARTWNLQASAFDSLNFFNGIESRRGSVTLKGDTTIDGKPAVRVSFLHPGKVEFIRVFEKKTGRLLSTEMADGVVLREEGEQVVSGVRFPQRVISISTRGDTPEKTVTTTTTITISAIKVNEKFDPAIFLMPNPNEVTNARK